MALAAQLGLAGECDLRSRELDSTPLEVYEHMGVGDYLGEHLEVLQSIYKDRMSVVLTKNGLPLGGAESVLLHDKKEPNKIVKVDRNKRMRPHEFEEQLERHKKLQAFFADSQYCILPHQQWRYESMSNDEYNQYGFSVRWQDWVDDVLRGETVDIHAGYVEDWISIGEGNDPEVYEKMNKALVVNPQGITDASELSQYNPIRQNDQLFHLLKGTEYIPELHECLADYVSRSIGFCQETGESMDMGGPHNVIVRLKDGRPQVVLIDPLYPTFRELKQTQHTLGMYFGSDRLGKGGVMTIRGGLHTVRILNYLAVRLGIPDRLDMNTLENRSDWQFVERLQSMPWTLLGQRMQAVYRENPILRRQM